MDSFKFTCPSCGQKLEGERDWIGEPTECPKCHNRFNIPDGDATPPEASVGGAPGYVPPSRSASTFETATGSNAQRQGGHTYSPPPPTQGFPPPQGGYAPPPQGFPPPQGGYAPPPQGGYAPPPQGFSPPQGGYAPPPPWGLPQTFVPNNPKEPVSAASFSYQRVGNKFYVIGDYPTVFAVVNDFCSRSQLQVEKSDINLGCITIKFNYENTHFVFFYQEFDKMIIEVASNAIKFQSAIDRQLQRLFEIVEAGLYQYRTGQYMPNICYDAMLPQSYQRAEIDYTSVAKTWVWAGPLFTIFVPFGFLIALIFGLISLVKIYSTRAKKGQEFVYISFGLDIVGLIFNIILWVLLW